MKQLYKNIYVAGQIESKDFASMAEFGIKTIINNRPDNEEPGQFTAAAAQALAAEHDIEYHYLPMANGQAMPPTLVNDFKSVVDSSNDPILVHCRSGMRSSFLWALGQIPAGKVTVDQAIEAAQAAGIPLGNARAALESVQP
jgi:sulfide:quinone oxidoreductase